MAVVTAPTNLAIAIWLTSANQQLQIVLDGDVAANELPWSVSYEELIGGRWVLKPILQGLTSSGTPVLLLQGSTNTRIVQQITIINADSASANFTVQLLNSEPDSPVTTPLAYATLATGAMCILTNGSITGTTNNVSA